ncbi:MAG: DUF2238 domain-containing protein [Verrucomicrobiales bacterium]|nr:DUF2238 domain-containing protein [Verrucomicrobiales bacterium]
MLGQDPARPAAGQTCSLTVRQLPGPEGSLGQLTGLHPASDRRSSISNQSAVSNRRYATILLVVFALIFAALAIDPVDRFVWALENALVALGMIIFIASHRSFRFSKLSYTLIFLFFCLHEIGSHYTYSLVPYDAWFKAVFGSSFNEIFGWERNHYDRLIHFLFGVLLAYPMREIFHRIAEARGFWGYFLPVCLTMTMSLIYELIEWGAAEVFGGDLGMAYLGTQGDIWDSHKDSLLATIGAVLSMAVALIINLWLQRDFGREWATSLKVKHPEPLGEEAIRKMLDEDKSSKDKPANR